MTVYNGKSFINNYRYTIFIVILWICIFISGFLAKKIVNIKKGIEKVSTIKDFLIAISIIINIYLLYTNKTILLFHFHYYSSYSFDLIRSNILSMDKVKIQ